MEFEIGEISPVTHFCDCHAPVFLEYGHIQFSNVTNNLFGLFVLGGEKCAIKIVRTYLHQEKLFKMILQHVFDLRDYKMLLYIDSLDHSHGTIVARVLRDNDFRASESLARVAMAWEEYNHDELN